MCSCVHGFVCIREPRMHRRLSVSLFHKKTGSKEKQESCAIAKMTARCALYK